MNNQNLFKTKTLNLAAFLQTKDCRLINIEQEGWQSVFIFEDTAKLLRLVDAYWYAERNDPQVQVDPRLLTAITKNLKSQIYS